MKWRYQYNNSGDKLTISREINESGARQFSNPDLTDMMLEYNKLMKKPGKECWHEKLGNHGRIVFDFDISKGTDKYQQVVEKYQQDSSYEPIGYRNDIESLIVESLRKLNRYKEVQILLQKEVEWMTFPFNSVASPFCWISGCREDKISYHLILPFITCILVDNGNGEEVAEGSETLQIAMKELYNTMSQICKDSYLLPDMNLLTKNHEIRLPGFCKYGYGPDTRLRFIGGHKIMHALSFIYPSYVSSDLHYVIDRDIIFKSLCDKDSSVNDEIDIELKDKLWNMIPRDIRDKYIDMEYKDGRFYMKPLSQGVECPVCCRCHEKNIPHISAYEGTYILTCWQWIRGIHTHMEGNGPIYIGQYGDTDIREAYRHKLSSRSVKRYNCVCTSSVAERDLISLNQRDLMYNIIGQHDLYIKSAMGTGKTKLLSHILNDKDSYLIISNKIMQAHKYNNIFPECTLYGSKDWTESSVKKLIVQMESIHHLKRDRYQYVILDEVESLLRILISETLYGKEVATISKLIDVISRCDIVIVMDAFLKDSTIEWIRSCRIGKAFKVIINEFKQIERSGYRVVNVIPKRTQFVAKIRDDNTKKAIACLSKSVANTLYDMLV